MSTKIKKSQNAITKTLNSIGDLTNYTYKDLKRAAVERGMPFDEVLKADFFKLNSFVHQNWDKPRNENLVTQFDDYIEEHLIAINQTGLIHPSLRLNYINSEDNDNVIKKEAKPKLVKKVKVRKEKNEDGIYSGTKKALTYELAKRGKSIEKTITRVQKKFPDAAEKSIKIWYKKALRENK